SQWTAKCNCTKSRGAACSVSGELCSPRIRLFLGSGKSQSVAAGTAINFECRDIACSCSRVCLPLTKALHSIFAPRTLFHRQPQETTGGNSRSQALFVRGPACLVE